MSLKLDRGLFKYDLIDHHAVLCVPVDADMKEIRKRYLKIARRLHPDSCAAASDVEKQIANELLSKLVNPAYEKLSVERSRIEYALVLSQMGKRLVQEAANVELSSNLAKQLAAAPNFDLLYKSAIAKIAETQFDSLPQAAQMIAHISELNLVYLMRSAGKPLATPQAAKSQATASQQPTNTGTAAPPPSAPKEDSVVEQYIRRAQTLIEKNQFAQAKVELQDALKLEPKNSRCHSLIAMVYIKQNQLKMAKVHFENALKLDPQDPTALEWKPKVDKVLAKQGGAGGASSSSHGDKQADKPGSGGLFGGLFGGKKK
ncbi:MAG TPA: J domain-containing protein [Nostocaceae cyanobacterium]|nr:J domain-containing protein [Nostocaceae cyanobacterium]